MTVTGKMQKFLMRAAMERALSASNLNASALDYVNAHATSTPAGDASEANALRDVFDPYDATPYVSSTKALTGHGLSLSGVMEAAFCVLALKEGFVPGQAHLTTLDPACAGINIPRSTLLNVQPRVVLNNTSGFGGSNVSQLFACYE